MRLDRGELDKIVERSMADMAGRGGYEREPEHEHGHDRDHDHHDRRGGFFGGQGDHHGRRKSWLSELFD